MSETISYANEARKQVGKYLVEQCGYAKRTATRFYKNGDEILSYCYFEKSRGITQVEIGVSPLYMPNSLWILNGRRLEELPFLLESASETQAEAWAESAIRCLKSGNLAFVESLCSPQKLLRIPLIIAPKSSTSSPLTKISRKSAVQAHCLHAK